MTNLQEIITDMATKTILDLTNHHIGDVSAIAVAAALEDNYAITYLNLANNNIGPESAKALAAALKHNSTLTQLSLFINNIGPEGAKALAVTLEHNHTLTYLDLSDNKIGPEGAKDLAAALENNHTLTRLDLSCNKIGNVGAKALAAALEHNHTLTVLDLNYNNIGDVGAKALAAVLRNNKYLRIERINNDAYSDEINKLNTNHRKAFDSMIKKLSIILRKLTTSVDKQTKQQIAEQTLEHNKLILSKQEIAELVTRELDADELQDLLQYENMFCNVLNDSPWLRQLMDNCPYFKSAINNTTSTPTDLFFSAIAEADNHMLYTVVMREKAEIAMGDEQTMIPKDVMKAVLSHVSIADMYPSFVAELTMDIINESKNKQQTAQLQQQQEALAILAKLTTSPDSAELPLALKPTSNQLPCTIFKFSASDLPNTISYTIFCIVVKQAQSNSLLSDQSVELSTLEPLTLDMAGISLNDLD